MGYTDALTILECIYLFGRDPNKFSAILQANGIRPGGGQGPRRSAERPRVRFAYSEFSGGEAYRQHCSFRSGTAG